MSPRRINRQRRVGERARKALQILRIRSRSLRLEVTRRMLKWPTETRVWTHGRRSGMIEAVPRHGICGKEARGRHCSRVLIAWRSGVVGRYRIPLNRAPFHVCRPFPKFSNFPALITQKREYYRHVSGIWSSVRSVLVGGRGVACEPGPDFLPHQAASVFLHSPHPQHGTTGGM